MPRRRSSRRARRCARARCRRDIRASIDQLVDKLERQVKRYREKRIEEPRRAMCREARRQVVAWAVSRRQPSRCTSRLADAVDVESSRGSRRLGVEPPPGPRFGGRSGWRRGDPRRLRAPRRWDAVVTVEAPGSARRPRRTSSRCPTGARRRRRRPADASAARRGVDGALRPPYRAEAIRRHDGACGRSPRGGSRSSTCRAGGRRDRAHVLGGNTTLASTATPTLRRTDALAGRRGRGPEYVVRARRLDGDALGGRGNTAVAPGRARSRRRHV